MHHIQLSKSDTELFKTLAVYIRDGNEEYYHLPQYFKRLDGDTYKVYSFNELPEYVKEELKVVTSNENEVKNY